MNFWHRILRLQNGFDELDPLKEEYSKSAKRVQEAAKNLARSAETVSRQKQAEELEKLVYRFRLSEGHD